MKKSKYIIIFLLLVILSALIGFFIFHRLERHSPEGIAGLYVVETPDTERVTVDVIFPYPAGPGPLAHYVEHLVWMNTIGADARSADRHTNAWTDQTSLGYWLSGEAEDLDELLQSLAGIFAPLTLADDFAAEERNIIMRECEMRRANQLDEIAQEALDRFLYDGNPIAASIVGTPAQIMALDYAVAKDFHATTHLPGHARLVIAGDVSERQVARALVAAEWPSRSGAVDQTAPLVFNLAAPATIRLPFVKEAVAPRLLWRRVVRLPAPVPFDLLDIKAALLREILIANLPGGLAGPLRFEAFIARSFDLHIWPLDENHIEISLIAMPDRDVTLDRLQTAFETTLSATAAAGIPDETYQRVLLRFEDYWPDWSDPADTGEWMADYINNRLSAARSPLSAEALQALHHEMTPEAINDLLRQAARPGRTAAAFIGSRETFE